MNDKSNTRYKILVSIGFGLLGFCINFFPLDVVVPPHKASFVWGLAFPMIISLSWGWKYGLLSLTLGFGGQTMWFLWIKNGWAPFIAIPVYNLWIVWHGWCAGKKKKGALSSFYGAEIPFRIFNTLIIYTLFRWVWKFNPSPWAPDLTLTTAPMAFVNFIAFKQLIEGLMVLFLADILLNFSIVQKILLQEQSRTRTGHIISASLLFGLFFWIITGIADFLLFKEHATLADSLILKATSHELFTRIIFIFTCLFAGLIVAKYVSRYKESEERYRIFFNNNHLAMLIIDPDTGEILDANPGACNFYGCDKEKLVSKKVSDINTLPESEIQKEMRNAKTEKRQYFFFKHRLADGSIRDVEVYSGPIKLRGQDLLYSVIHDISQRKKAEEELKFTQFAVDHSSDAAFWITSDAKFYYINDAAVNKLGYSQEELLQMSVSDIDPDFPLEAWSSHWQELKQKKTLHFEARHQTKAGSIFPVEVVANYIEFGDRAYNCAFVRDISDRKGIEAKLQQAQKMEAIGTLAGGIAHDFNNILTVIIGYGEIVLRTLAPGSSLYNNQTEVIKAGNRAKDLVQQILSFSRQTEFEKKPIQINLMVKETTKMLRATIPTTIEIRQDVEDCGVVMADSTQLHQIIMNLCTNAFQAMPTQEGVIGISLHPVTIDSDDRKVKVLDLRPGKYVELEVSDTGHGIDQEMLDKIFEPYYTTKEKGKGTGLGLAVVHGIVKSMNGHITVYSEKNRGTKFCVHLPVKMSGPEKEARLERTPDPLGTEKILILDDEEAIVTMGELMLKPLGYHTYAFTSVMDAWESFKENPQQFDLVITDMTMPGMTGAEFAQKLKSLRADIPVILCTGFSELIDNGKAKSMGINKYLTKPVSQHELAKTVREVLDRNIL